MGSFLLAFRFLTSFPLGGAGEKVDAKKLADAMAFFPVVGAVQGLVLAAFYLLLAELLPTEIVPALLVVVLVFTNNALHLDGLADTVDGIAGGKDREDILRIMRTSDIGPMGVVSIVLVLMVKYFSIASLPAESAIAVIVLFPAFARYAMVPMAALAPYARKSEGGLGEIFASNSARNFMIATAIMLAISLPLLGWKALIILLTLLIFVYLLTSYFKRRLGGVTGDVLGFQSELAELFTLLVAIIFLSRFGGA